jgi:hypothetical protein
LLRQLGDFAAIPLKEMGVPAKYSDLMFSIPGDQMRWIDEADFDADFYGLIPELRDWMNAKCDSRTDVEKKLGDVLDDKRKRGQDFTPEEQSMWGMLLQKLKNQVECEGMTEDKMRADAWKSYRGL